MSEQRECFWKCGDPAPGHGHSLVSVSKNGRWVGNLTPAGRTTRLRVYTAVLSHARASEVAEQISGGGEFTAKARRF